MTKNRHRQYQWYRRSAPAALAIALALGTLPDAMSQGLPPGPVAPPTTPSEAEALSRTLYSNESETSAQPDEKAVRQAWKLTPRASVSAEYDDNIFIASKNKKADSYFTFSPGGTFGLGDFEEKHGNFLLLDYSASIIRFAKHTTEDAIEQQAALSMQYRLSRLTIGLQFHFQDLAGPDVDVGDRTKRQIFQTSLLTSYEISDKTYLETNLYSNVSDYVTQLSSTELSLRSSINYRWTSKVTAGIGGIVGQLNVDQSGTQTFERPFVSLNYTATDKLLLECDAGIEIRQYENKSPSIDPVFHVMATFRPFDGTELLLNAYRKTENSATYVGQNYTVTGVSMEVHRDIMQRLRLSFGAGYENANYTADTTAYGSQVASRDDHYLFVRPSMRFSFRENCYIELYYQFRQNDSTATRYGFDDAQTGIQLTLSY
jgi:hypothetical protein